MLIHDINQGNFKLNIIGLQEIWSLPDSYDNSFAGYSEIEFNLRNNNSRVKVLALCTNTSTRNARPLLRILSSNFMEKIDLKIFPLKASLNHFPSYQLPTTWNKLTLTYKSIDSFRMFKDNLKELFLSSYNS